LGDQLRGKRAGIVGLNSITYELVNTLRNLGVSVQVCDCGVSQDTNLKPYDLGISEFVSQKQLLAQSDVVYIVDGKVTDLDSTFLNKIEKPIYLISTVRHKKVDTKTIRNLIYKGLLKGLVLDGLIPQLLLQKDASTSDVLRDIVYLPNVLLTPEISWYTQEAVRRANDDLLEKLVAYANHDFSYLI
jgi:phosphoglycerate dehydrogenase-like enzyme